MFHLLFDILCSLGFFQSYVLWCTVTVPLYAGSTVYGVYKVQPDVYFINIKIAFQAGQNARPFVRPTSHKKTTLEVV
jgi:hypothetical protein